MYLRKNFCSKFAERNVQAGEVATVVEECRYDFQTAAIFHVRRDLVAGEKAMQRFHRETVTGVDAQNRFGVGDRALEFDFDFRGERVEQRRQTGGDTLIRPDEFFAQRGEFGAAAACGFDQRRAEDFLAAAQNAPCIAVGELRACAGFRQAAVFADADEQVDEALHNGFAVQRLQLPRRADLDLEHYL